MDMALLGSEAHDEMEQPGEEKLRVVSPVGLGRWDFVRVGCNEEVGREKTLGHDHGRLGDSH